MEVSRISPDDRRGGVDHQRTNRRGVIFTGHLNESGRDHDRPAGDSGDEADDEGHGEGGGAGGGRNGDQTGNYANDCEDFFGDVESRVLLMPVLDLSRAGIAEAQRLGAVRFVHETDLEKVLRVATGADAGGQVGFRLHVHLEFIALDEDGEGHEAGVTGMTAQAMPATRATLATVAKRAPIAATSTALPVYSPRRQMTVISAAVAAFSPAAAAVIVAAVALAMARVASLATAPPPTATMVKTTAATSMEMIAMSSPLLISTLPLPSV